MPIPRLRVRTLMITVAVTAMGLGLGVAALRAGSRAASFRRRAEIESLQERSFGIDIIQDGRPVERAEYLRLNRQWFAYHAMLRRKYEYAAAHPWLPVPPDPPDPVANGTPGREVSEHTE